MTATGTSQAERRAEFGAPIERSLPPSGRFKRRSPLLTFGIAIAEGPTTREVLGRDALARRLLVVADLLAAALALIACVTLIGDDQLRLASLGALPVAVFASKVIGLYDRDELLLRKSTLDEAPGLFQLATLYALIVWLLEGVLIDGELGNAQVLGLWATLFIAVVVGRRVARGAARSLLDRERCLVIGDAASSEHVRQKIDGSHRLHASVVARMPFVPQRIEDEQRRRRQWGADEVGRVAERYGVHRVILAPGAGESDELLDLTRTAKGLGLKVTVLPRVFEVVGSQVEFDDLEGITVLGVRRFELSRSSLVLKRTLDLTGALLGTIVVSPILAVIAVAIRLDSSGPVFFRQVRIGRDGGEFELLKFRTMEEGADARKPELAALNEADGLFKITNDPRVTRVGRFLRRTSLDELPQLFNVIKAEMSLVGPRPLVAEDDERVEGWHRRRLHLTPGMTGQWQILGSARIPLREMVKIDYLYVANWSLWSDVKILLRTVPYMLARRGQ